jgi:hypothetical protein
MSAAVPRDQDRADHVHEIEEGPMSRTLDDAVVVVTGGGAGVGQAQSASRGRLAHVLDVGSEHSLGVPPHVPPLSTYTVTKYTSLAGLAADHQNGGE